MPSNLHTARFIKESRTRHPGNPFWCRSDERHLLRPIARVANDRALTRSRLSDFARLLAWPCRTARRDEIHLRLRQRRANACRRVQRSRWAVLLIDFGGGARARSRGRARSRRRARRRARSHGRTRARAVTMRCWRRWMRKSIVDGRITVVHSSGQVLFPHRRRCVDGAAQCRRRSCLCCRSCRGRCSCSRRSRSSCHCCCACNSRRGCLVAQGGVHLLVRLLAVSVLFRRQPSTLSPTHGRNEKCVWTTDQQVLKVSLAVTLLLREG